MIVYFCGNGRGDDKDRGLRIFKRYPDQRAGEPRWLRRLALLSALRFRRLLRVVVRHPRQWPLAFLAESKDRDNESPISREHADSINGNRNEEWHGAFDRLYDDATRYPR